jgi:hypothetical protein
MFVKSPDLIYHMTGVTWDGENDPEPYNKTYCGLEIEKDWFIVYLLDDSVLEVKPTYCSVCEDVNEAILRG